MSRPSGFPPRAAQARRPGLAPLGGALALALAALAADAAPAAAQQSAPAATPAAARSFGAGDGLTTLGVLDAPPEAEIEGPQAIAAGDDGTIYLLDQVNARVVTYAPGKEGEAQQSEGKTRGVTRSLALPPGSNPTDMVVSGGQIYVWDGKPIRLGDGLTRSLAPSDDVDESTRAMFGQFGAPAVEPAAGATTRSVGKAGAAAAAPETRPNGRQMVVSRGAGPVVASVTRGKDQKSATLIVTRKEGGTPLARLEMKARDRLGAIDLLDIDKYGRFFVMSEQIPAGGGATSFVARFAPNGALEGAHQLPLGPDVALSRRFVTVDPVGDVYFLRTRKGVVDVVPVGFTPFERTQAIDLAPPVQVAALGDAPVDMRIAPVSAVRPLSREEVIRTAYQFAEVRWRVTPTAYGPEPDASCQGFNARVRRPSYMIGKAQQEVKGIPYCWGCMGSLTQIAARINSGVKAGNVCTRNDPRRDAAGVDCSAFVSATWGLSTHFTTQAIPSITVPVGDPYAMLPGDALNKPGSHVMLFIGYTADRKAEVIEASPGACGGRVCRNVYPLGSLLARGYTPRRYRGLTTASAAATPARAATHGPERN